MVLDIISDHVEATVLLQKISSLCAAHGAQWNSDLQVEVDQGCMRLLAPPGSSGRLITMPTALLVPIAGAQWSIFSDELKLLQPPRDATRVQHELLQLHVELYNTTGKLDWWINNHPARLVETSGKISALLALLKPSFKVNPKLSFSERFLATRYLRWRSNSDQSLCNLMLMPLIELINHHEQGAPFRFANGAMQIQTKQADGCECFARYGIRRDVLDFALHYGHCDLSTPFAHCAPLTTAVDGLGYVRIKGQGHGAPVHPFDPPRVTLEQDGISLSHLCCNWNHPERIQIMLSLALEAHLKGRGYTAASASQMAIRCLNAIGEDNLLLLKQLAAAAQSSSHPAAPKLAEAAQRQASIIRAVLQ